VVLNVVGCSEDEDEVAGRCTRMFWLVELQTVVQERSNHVRDWMATTRAKLVGTRLMG
jgi:hypothetical protein